MTAALPAQVRVLVRDWLSSNNIVLRSGAGHVVIDSGYHTVAARTLQLLRTGEALASDPLALLVNTHCHSDHIGGNAEIRAAYGCPIAIPAGEAHLIDPWNPDGLWLGYADQFAPQFRYDALIEPGDINVWGDLEWEALSAPGHDMGALMFWNRQHRVLITGDALWANGFGFVLPVEMDARCIPAAHATLGLIATLDAAVVIPGHGAPFADVDEALERSRSKLAALAADPARNARYIMKVMLSYVLLSGRRIKLAGLPAYCETVPVLRELNARFLQLDANDLSRLLFTQLEQSGAIALDGEYLVAR